MSAKWAGLRVTKPCPFASAVAAISILGLLCCAGACNTQRATYVSWADFLGRGMEVLTPWQLAVWRLGICRKSNPSNGGVLHRLVIGEGREVWVVFFMVMKGVFSVFGFGLATGQRGQTKKPGARREVGHRALLATWQTGRQRIRQTTGSSLAEVAANFKEKVFSNRNYPARTRT